MSKKQETNTQSTTKKKKFVISFKDGVTVEQMKQVTSLFDGELLEGIRSAFIEIKDPKMIALLDVLGVAENTDTVFTTC